MADLNIRKEFVDGMHEVFTALFNDGESEGIHLYLLSENNTSVYKENKYKKYKAPITLVAQADVNLLQGNKDVEEMKYHPTFIVPLKSLQNRDLSVDRHSLDNMKRGVIEFQGVFYRIIDIVPKAYIQDVFLFYHFVCLEDKQVTNILVEEVSNE